MSIVIISFSQFEGAFYVFLNDPSGCYQAYGVGDKANSLLNDAREFLDTDGDGFGNNAVEVFKNKVLLTVLRDVSIIRMKTLVYYKTITLGLLLLFAQGAAAFVFEVTTAEEFQAALTTAASNGGDDEIILPAAKLAGPFRFVNREQFDLRIIGRGQTRTVLSGVQQSFVLEINLNGFNDIGVEIERLSLVEGRSVSNGAGLNVVTGIAQPYPSGEFALPTISITDVTFDNNEVSPGAAGSSVSVSHATVMLNGVSISNSKYTPGFESYDDSSAITCNFCALSVSDSEFEDIETLIINVKNGSLFIQNTLLSGVWPVLVRFNKNAGGGFLNSVIKNLGIVKIQDSRVTRTATGRSFGYSNGKPIFDFYGVKNLEMIGNLVDDHSFLDNRDVLPILNFWGGDFENSVVKLERNRVTSNQSVVCYPTGEVRGHLNFGGAFEIELISNLIAFESADEASSRDYCLGLDLFSMNGFSQTSILNNTMVYVQSFEEQVVHFLSYASSEGANTRLEVANNIFWGVGASDKSAFKIRLRPTEALLKHNIVTKNVGFWDTKVNNIDTDPKFFDVIERDYHLATDSPGINTGDNSFIAAEARDVSGADRVTEQIVDIGAYERSTSALHPADSNGDRSISQAEFAAYNASWRTNDVWATAPTIIPINFVTRAGYLLEKGGAYKNIGVGKPQTWVPDNE